MFLKHLCENAMGKHVYDCALLVGLTNLWRLSYKYGAKICRHFVIQNGCHFKDILI